ncbi:ABC transporter ATP-binding protein [Nocardioides donggukensis]|uniref:ABC-type quaternary amine transporter n=1 Tax=Nocardioides donggukensis TaxID=2774019 RepID=A0A927K268_9ACTN|nr:ABC transporter ATP-binding protein [Nocardioides donggukensis]MBD8868251.1 ABC transporter ATP-binding protein [Nocardioides donggukensis]
MRERLPGPESPGPASARLEVRRLVVRYAGVPAVDGIDLALEPGSFTALLGPSGCGKSTTLAVLAGLQRADEGEVLLDGTALGDTAPERRPLSLVFQKPLLFPHLTVAQNVGFGLRMRRVPRREAAAEVAAMLERVRLDGLADRRIGELSGGQEQRVSLARALVRRPRVLLLDEPFSQLDADLRAEMRTLVRELHDEAGVTTLFVTHDREEAVEVSDRIALMLDGRIAGSGTPQEIYTRPPTLRTARFFGFENEIRGQVAGGVFRSADGTVSARCDLAPGAATLVVRPEAVRLGPAGEDTGTARAGAGGIGPSVRVKDQRFAGTHVVVDVALPDGQRLRAHVPVGSEPAVGERVGVWLPPERCTVLAEVDPTRTSGTGAP